MMKVGKGVKRSEESKTYYHKSIKGTMLSKLFKITKVT